MFNWLRRKDNSVSRVVLNEIAEWLGYKTSTGASVTPATAVQVTAVMCAVRVIAEGVAQMPMRIRERKVVDGKDFSPDARDHWSWTLMVKKPNSWQTPYEFREYAIAMAVLFGDFAAVKNGPKRGGKITELLPLVPGSWKIEQNKQTRELTYVIDLKDGQKLRTPASDIFHFHGPPHTDSYSGIEPVKVARNAIGLSQSLESQQSNLSANGGRPSGLLSSDNKINPEKAKLIKEQWTDKFGSGGEGGVAVLDGGWKFSTMQMTSADAEHLDTRKFQIEEIARLFYVFPTMLMQSDKASTFASAESFFRAHVTWTLRPWVLRFENAVDRDILAGEKERDLFADLDEKQLLRGDFKDQANYNAKALGAGGTPAWLTQNEVRESIGMEPLNDPNADRLFGGFQEEQSPDNDEDNDKDETDD
jgi:HK97 family phage portal protein